MSHLPHVSQACVAQPAAGHHALFALCFIYPRGTLWLWPSTLLAVSPDRLSSGTALGTVRSAAEKVGEADRE